MSEHTQHYGSLGEKLVAAGFETPFQRTLRIGIEAWRLFPNAGEGGERRAHVTGKLSTEHTWRTLQELQLSAIADQLVGYILNRARKVASAQRAQERSRQSFPEIPTITAAAGGQAIQATRSTYISSGRPSLEPSRPPALSKAMPSQALRQNAAKLKAGAVVCQRLLVETINGRPIAECSAGEAQKEANRLEPAVYEVMRKKTFLRMISSGMPSNRVLGEAWPKSKEAEVEAMARRAAEHAKTVCDLAVE